MQNPKWNPVPASLYHAASWWPIGCFWGNPVPTKTIHFLDHSPWCLESRKIPSKGSRRECSSVGGRRFLCLDVECKKEKKKCLVTSWLVCLWGWTEASVRDSLRAGGSQSGSRGRQRKRVKGWADAGALTESWSWGRGVGRLNYSAV